MVGLLVDVPLEELEEGLAEEGDAKLDAALGNALIEFDGSLENVSVRVKTGDVMTIDAVITILVVIGLGPLALVGGPGREVGYDVDVGCSLVLVLGLAPDRLCEGS